MIRIVKWGKIPMEVVERKGSIAVAVCQPSRYGISVITSRGVHKGGWQVLTFVEDGGGWL